MRHKIPTAVKQIKCDSGLTIGELLQEQGVWVYYEPLSGTAKDDFLQNWVDRKLAAEANLKSQPGAKALRDQSVAVIQFVEGLGDDPVYLLAVLERRSASRITVLVRPEIELWLHTGVR